MAPRPRLVISACLLGERVRYDGRQKGEPALVRALRTHAELVPLCPEVEFGLPVPRPPMQLEGDPGEPRLIVISPREDLTARFQDWTASRLAELAADPPAGFVLKARSPSCGVTSTPVFDGGEAVASGGGMFARAVRLAFPSSAVAEEAELLAPGGLERFLNQIT